MNIGGFQKVDLVNFPGIMAATGFTMGCDCRCPYCHNPTLVESLEPLVLEEKVFSYLSERRGLLEGVVVSGGEPCLQKDLPDFLSALKKIGLKVKLDTNGSYPRMLSELITDGLVDYVAMDIKAPLNDKYDDLTGISAPLDDIKRSIEILEASGIEHEYRTTLSPILLNAADIEAIAAYIGGAQKYALQQFRPQRTLDPHLESAEPMSKAQVKAIAENAKRYVRKVVVRGDV